MTGCFPSNPMSTFDTAGPIAEMQLNLFYIIFWTAVVVFVAVEGALVYAMVKFRRRPGQGIPKQTHGNDRLEIAWTIAPTLILAAIAVPTIITIFDTANPPPGEILEVTVTGHQWWFEFEYPELGISTANELHVPVGMTVNLSLESDDVIHSFWVPKLFGKTDLIPGNTNPMWFAADEAGEYYGQCAEFCGTAHAHMRFRVIAEDEASFNEWVANQQAPVIRPESGTQEALGQRVFGLSGCGTCHTITGSEPEDMQEDRMEAFMAREEGAMSPYPAPNLTHFASRGTFAGSVKDLTEANLRLWLEDPSNLKPGTRMKQLAVAYNPMSLGSEDLDQLIAYLMSLE
ncbi:MAG: cytochrome c oxidase subunit II [Chloroflexi bacterium]|nr:cytochrome c oxidase subunit II [Chloroflexota bacterium]